ncbi:MAG: DUF1848 domain-containing protein [Candidatus Kapaibacterium sp.]
MIISASRRTDIPAFYGEWFAARIREGWCEVANPFNSKQITPIDLGPEAVDAIVFWTRNASRFGECMDMLDSRGYKYYFNYTLNNYPEYLEPHGKSTAEAIADFEKLSGRIGPERVVWRYDPIILAGELDFSYHIKIFSELVNNLSGMTRRAITSIATPYRKTRSRLVRAGLERLCESPEGSELQRLIGAMSEITTAKGIELRVCSSPIEFASAPPAKCLDDEILRAIGVNIKYIKDKSQRAECCCTRSRDIGAYDCCPRGCLYCYAVSSHKRVADRIRKHEPTSPRLIP